MAISGKIKLFLTTNYILESISEYEIYQRFFGNFKLNVVTKNHLRGDRESSFIIGYVKGNLRHIDFGDSYWGGDCFDLVMQIYSCSLQEALEIIYKDFNFNELKTKPIIETNEIIQHKKYDVIQCVTRNFTKEELAYWNQYFIDISELKKNNVFSLKSVFLNKERYVINNIEMRFGYYFNGYWKIYIPFGNSKRKWMSNVPLVTLDSPENIKDVIWITKSKKDLMVLNKLFPNVIATQNESIRCFSESNIELIKNNSEKQILIFDNDVPGIRACKEITTKLDMSYFNIPRSYISDGISDPSDLVREYGINKLEQILKRKKLI